MQTLVSDDVTAQLSPIIARVAKKLLEIQKEGRFVLVKFHHDADGISAALAISSFLSCKTVQQNAALYNAREALRDLASIHHEHKPVVILADLGSGSDSIEGLKLLKAAGVSIFIIDHHPLAEEVRSLADEILNPWSILNNEQASRYPAGYLACEVARHVGVSNIDELAYVSCAADKSTALEVSQKHKDQALVLDYLAMHSGYGNNLRFYKNVLSKQELYDSILGQVQEKVSQIGDDAMRFMKPKSFGGLDVYTLDLADLLARHEFPSKSKITTYVIEHLSPAPAIVLGYNERTIVARANQATSEMGIKLNELINELKGPMANFIESGGGHAKASAIRVRPGFSKEVLSAFIELIAKKLGS